MDLADSAAQPVVLSKGASGYSRKLGSTADTSTGKTLYMKS
jgi:hypothetical protein